MSQHSPAPDAAVTDRYPAGHILPLTFGRWRAEVRGDELAEISFDGVPLLRAVRPVVRDEDWNTLPVRVLDQTTNDSMITTNLVFEAPGIEYEVKLTISLTHDDLTVDFAGRARSAFRRNRIGLVVLHLADDVGRPVDVVHTDGASSSGRWPETISPHQPFRDVTGFRWVRDGVRVSLDLSGDVFETEDQRNWTDYSFKTYSTPLSLPFPVDVEIGDVVNQRVRLRATGQRSSTTTPRSSDFQVKVAEQIVGTVPLLGLGAFVHPGPTPRDRDEQTGSGFASVLLELSGSEADWNRQVELARDQAADLGAALDVRLVPDSPGGISRGLDLVVAAPLLRLAAFDRRTHGTTAELWSRLESEVRSRGLDVELVAGTRAHFTELNRQFDQLPGDAPALTLSITPQMHASELAHIVDSLDGQRLVAENAIRLAAGRPVHIGPVTLARRFNAVATSAPPDPATEAENAIDDLQPSEFTAAWTLASIAALTQPGVVSLTYFETSGPRGIRSPDGTAYPVARVLRWVAGLSGHPVLESSAPRGIAVYGVQRGSRVEVALANLTPDAADLDLEILMQARAVSVPGWSVQLLSLP